MNPEDALALLRQMQAGSPSASAPDPPDETPPEDPLELMRWMRRRAQAQPVAQAEAPVDNSEAVLAIQRRMAGVRQDRPDLDLPDAVRDGSYVPIPEIDRDRLASDLVRQRMAGQQDARIPDAPRLPPRPTYEAWRAALPENLRETDTTHYDLRGAYDAGVQPEMGDDGQYHLPSRDARTGRLLKRPTHPTYQQALEADAAMGYRPVEVDGETYTLRPGERPGVADPLVDGALIPNARPTAANPTTEEQEAAWWHANRDAPVQDVAVDVERLLSEPGYYEEVAAQIANAPARVNDAEQAVSPTKALAELRAMIDAERRGSLRQEVGEGIRRGGMRAGAGLAELGGLVNRAQGNVAGAMGLESGIADPLRETAESAFYGRSADAQMDENFVRWLAATTGETIPQMGAAAAGFALGGPAAAFAVNAPLMMGDEIGEATHDPETGERRVASGMEYMGAIASGLAQAGFETAAESKIFGRIGEALQGVPPGLRDEAARQTTRGLLGAVQRVGAPAVRSALEESGTEVLQQLTSNLTALARGDERVLTEGLLESAVAGAVIGGGLTGTTGVVGEAANRKVGFRDTPGLNETQRAAAGVLDKLGVAPPEPTAEEGGSVIGDMAGEFSETLDRLAANDPAALDALASPDVPQAEAQAGVPTEDVPAAETPEGAAERPAWRGVRDDQARKDIKGYDELRQSGTITPDEYRAAVDLAEQEAHARKQSDLETRAAALRAKLAQAGQTASGDGQVGAPPVVDNQPPVGESALPPIEEVVVQPDEDPRIPPAEESVPEESVPEKPASPYRVERDDDGNLRVFRTGVRREVRPLVDTDGTPLLKTDGTPRTRTRTVPDPTSETEVLDRRSAGYEPALVDYFTTQAEQIEQETPRLPAPETEAELDGYLDAVASEATNPFELAEAYQQARDQEASEVVEGDPIADFFRSGGRVRFQDVADLLGVNPREAGIVYPGYFGQEADALDRIAQTLDLSIAGQANAAAGSARITEQDVVDWLVAHGRTPAPDTSLSERLATRFQEAWGVGLTQTLAESLIQAEVDAYAEASGTDPDAMQTLLTNLRENSDGQWDLVWTSQFADDTAQAYLQETWGLSPADYAALKEAVRERAGETAFDTLAAEREGARRAGSRAAVRGPKADAGDAAGAGVRTDGPQGDGAIGRESAPSTDEMPAGAATPTDPAPEAEETGPETAPVAAVAVPEDPEAHRRHLEEAWGEPTSVHGYQTLREVQDEIGQANLIALAQGIWGFQGGPKHAWNSLNKALRGGAPLNNLSDKKGEAESVVFDLPGMDPEAPFQYPTWEDVPFEVMQRYAEARQGEFPDKAEAGAEAALHTPRRFQTPLGRAVDAATQKRLDADAEIQALENEWRERFGGNVQSGIDPEQAALAFRIVAAYVKKGVFTLAEVSAAAAERLGDDILPYIRSAYAAVQTWNAEHDPEIAAQMDPANAETAGVAPANLADELGTSEKAIDEATPEAPTAEAVVEASESLMSAEERDAVAALVGETGPGLSAKAKAALSAAVERFARTGVLVAKGLKNLDARARRVLRALVARLARIAKVVTVALSVGGVTTGAGVQMARSIESGMVSNVAEMAQNYAARHFALTEDPHFAVATIEADRPSLTTFGTDRLPVPNAPEGTFYTNFVLDLSGAAPPSLTLINERGNTTPIEGTAGIVINTFEPFHAVDDFTPRLKREAEMAREDTPVLAFDPATGHVRAGTLGEVGTPGTMVSETYSVPFEPVYDEDGQVKLVRHPQAIRMVPVVAYPDGREGTIPLGITRDRAVTAIDPSQATTYGLLEGGKVVLVSGEHQATVAGSVADIFAAAEALKTRSGGEPVAAYLLDNGSYTLPYLQNDGELSAEDLRSHFNRNRGGGYGLALNGPVPEAAADSQAMTADEARTAFAQEVFAIKDAAEAEVQALYPGQQVEIRVYGLERSLEEQARAQAAGNSRTQVSAHNVGMAADFAVFVDGALVNPPSRHGDTAVHPEHAPYRVIGRHARQRGYFWGLFWDAGHVQFRRGLSEVLQQRPALMDEPVVQAAYEEITGTGKPIPARYRPFVEAMDDHRGVETARSYDESDAFTEEALLPTAPARDRAPARFMRGVPESSGFPTEENGPNQEIDPIERRYPLGTMVEIAPGELGPGIERTAAVEEIKQRIIDEGRVRPIEITPDGFIVDGEHRYAALMDLGVERIPAYVGEQLGGTGRLVSPYPGLSVPVTGRGVSPQLAGWEQRQVQAQIDAVEEVRDAEGNLLAPNGQPSNLNELQWKLVRTPNFIAWFGDWINDPANASKVVDENGEPLVVYHGTASDFNAFDPASRGQSTGAKDAKKAFFFSADPGVAASYLPREDGLNEKGAALLRRLEEIEASPEYQRHVSLLAQQRSPGLSVQERRELREVVDRTPVPPEYAEHRRLRRALLDDAAVSRPRYHEATERGSVMAVFLSAKDVSRVDMNGAAYNESRFTNVLAEAAAEGKSGAVLEGVSDDGDSSGLGLRDVYAVFGPSQIKSATGNRGTYDPENPDVRFMRGDLFDGEGTRAPTEQEKAIDKQLTQARARLSDARRDLAREERKEAERARTASTDLFGSTEAVPSVELPQLELPGTEANAATPDEASRVLKPYRDTVRALEQEVLRLEREANAARQALKNQTTLFRYPDPVSREAIPPVEESEATTEAHQQAQAAVQTLVDKGLPPVHVVQSPLDLPEALWEEYAYQRGEGAPPIAIFLNGEVGIITSEFPEGVDPAAFARQVYQHEVISHLGLRALLGDELHDATMLRIYEAVGMAKIKAKGPDGQDSIFARYKRDMENVNNPTDADKIMLAEEYMAQLAEGMKVDEKTLWEKIKRIIQRALSAISGTISDADLEVLLEAAADHLMANRAGDPVTATRYLYAGPNAETFDPEQAFESPYDGKPRMEIDDSDARLAVTPDENGVVYRATSLSEVLTHPALYDAYPDARDILVLLYIDPRTPEEDSNSGLYTEGTPGDEQYFGRDPEIRVRADSPAEALSILLHEVQHHLQHTEGFAKGGNQQVARNTEGFAEEVDRRMSAHREEGGWTVVNPTPGERGAVERQVAQDRYNRLAGEIEARDVQARQNLSAEARAATPPYSSEQIAPDRAIVRFMRVRRSADPSPIVAAWDGSYVGKRAGRAGNTIAAGLRARGDLPPSAFEAKWKRDGLVKAVAREVERTATTLSAAMKGHYGKDGPGEADVRLLDEVFRMERPLDAAPEPLRAPLAAMRRHAEKLAGSLRRFGYTAGDLEFAFGAGGTVIFKRIYRATTDPAWRDKVRPDVVNNATAALRGFGIPEAELASYIESLMSGDAATIEAVEKIAATTTASGRRTLDPAVRSLLGEVADPRATYARGVMDMANEVMEKRFAFMLREYGLNGTTLGSETYEPFLYTDDRADRPPEASVQIKANGVEALKAIDGLYATPETAAALKEIGEAMTEAKTFIGRAYFSGMSLAKSSKVVWSWMTTLANYFSGYMFSARQGYWTPKHYGTAHALALGNHFGTTKGEREAFLTRLVQEGLLDMDLSAGMINALAADSKWLSATEIPTARWLDNVVKGAKATQRWMGNLYQAMDNIHRIKMVLSELDAQREAHPDWTEPQIWAEMSRRVRDLYPNYNMLSPALKATRKLPFAPFAAFTSEQIRTDKNTLKTAWNDMRDDNAVVKKQGYRRLASFIAAHAITPALWLGSMALLGMDREDDKAVRRLMPSYLRGAPLLYYRTDEGYVDYLPLGRLDPFASYKSLFVIPAQGSGDLPERLTDAALGFVEPFTSEDVFSGALLQAYMNEDQWGREITPGDETGVSMLWDLERMKHAGGAFVPGAFLQGKRWVESFGTDRVEEESVGMLLGERPRRVSASDVRYRAGERKEEIQHAQTRFTAFLADLGDSIDEGDVQREADRMVEARWDAMVEAYYDAQAALRLGGTPAAVQAEMQGNRRFSEAMIGSVLDGNYDAYDTARLLSTQIGNAEGEAEAALKARRATAIAAIQAAEQRLLAGD